MRSKLVFNPFPGLRSFEADEDHLFFGREKEIDELLRRLRTTHFVSVVGSSGSGKSSLVRCGLISALYSGFMVRAGSGWRVAQLRPSEDPIGNLASALNSADVLGTDGEMASTNRILVEATLRRGTLGLVEAVRQARIPRDENVLVVVDQFEELFRFRRSNQIENSKDEAMAFVKLILEAAHQDDLPIYIVLTMRSDFIGDCLDYPGLPEAVNAGQYLIPRMSRDQIRTAITGPVAVGGGQIAQRLVLRLLNDLGDDPDQLPVLQHALMRCWEHWQRRNQPAEPIDIPDYEAIGTMQQALSLHAEEAYNETRTEHGTRIAERIFKELTDTVSDPRGVRRPTSVQELAAICEASESDVIQVIEVFRHPERSFLTPNHKIPLDSRSIIDLSHESLMRCWTRLMAWAAEERISFAFYARLVQAAAWFEEGSGGLWRDPELELGLQWRRKNQPTAAWAEHHFYSSFDQAMDFLDRSEKERNRTLAEREAERKRKLRQYQLAAVILGILLIVVGILGQIARRESNRAEENLQLAQNAVDEMLSSAGREQARVAGDMPQMEEFRKELLDKAKGFYDIFTKEKPDNEGLRQGAARAHFRLGDIQRLQQKPDEAAKEYGAAINEFESLLKDHPRTEYRQALANSYNWLGETLRPQPEAASDAERAYDNAMRLQTDLVREAPQNTLYQRELARTHYNRGILRYAAGRKPDADSDFREAIRLLEPAAMDASNLAAAQELARVYNNLANLLRSQDRLPEARTFFERAVQTHQTLVNRQPDNREFKQELAIFNNNLALLLLDQQQLTAAEQQNRLALNLMDDLARPAPSLSIELVGAHNLRCQMLAAQKPREAETECQRSLDMLQRLGGNRPEVQRLYRDLGYNYLDLLKTSTDSDRVREILSRILPLIPEPDRTSLTNELRRSR